MRSGLEGSRVVEALDRFAGAYPRTMMALAFTVNFGTMAAIPFYDPWEGMMVPFRVGVFAVGAVLMLPRYAVLMLRAWDGPDRLMWLGGLAAHLAWFGLAMAGGPNVGFFTVNLAFAAAIYIEETVLRRVATDRAGATETGEAT